MKSKIGESYEQKIGKEKQNLSRPIIYLFNRAGGATMISTGMANNNNCTYFDRLNHVSLVGYEVGWLWYDVIALILYAMLFLTIAYLVLLFIKKEK